MRGRRTVDGDGVLGPEARHVPRHGVAHRFVDGDDPRLGLFGGEPPQKQIDVGRRVRRGVVVLPDAPLRRLRVLGQRRETRQHRAARRDHVAPVHELRERVLCEDRPVLPELVEVGGRRRRPVRAPLGVGEGHDVVGGEVVGT